MQLDPNRPYMTEKEARRFTKDYMKLNKLLSERLLMAETKAEAKQPLEMKIEEAIVYVLASSGHGMKTEQIAREINERCLFHR